MRSVKRRPRRCVLVLNSACCRSAVVGLGCDLPNMEDSIPIIKPITELLLVLTGIIINELSLHGEFQISE